MFEFEIDSTNYYENGLNNITNWYPILRKYGIPTPQTHIVFNNCGDDLFQLLDGVNPKDIRGFNFFEKNILSAIEYIRGESRFNSNKVFIKTGLISSKHKWEESCVYKGNNLYTLLNNLIEASAIADMRMPFSIDYFAVREMIDTKIYFYAFQNMPITKEVRVFVKDGEIKCYHPYRPKEALKDHTSNIEDFENIYKELTTFYKEDGEQFLGMAKFISSKIPGYWSIDFLQDKNLNWYCIDMADGNASYHMDGCEHIIKSQN